VREIVMRMVGLVSRKEMREAVVLCSCCVILLLAESEGREGLKRDH